jgi:hypothetical protein
VLCHRTSSLALSAFLLAWEGKMQQRMDRHVLIRLPSTCLFIPAVVFQSCHNKTAQIGLLKQHTLIFSQFRRLETKIQVSVHQGFCPGFVVCRWPSPCCVFTWPFLYVCLCCLFMSKFPLIRTL